MLRHIPNILSAFRIPAALLLFAIYDPGSRTRSSLCVALSILIMVSDFLDGRLARKYSLVSKVGYVLDGLGDRAVNVSVFLLFVTYGILNAMLAWALIFREICVYALRLLEADWHEAMPGTEHSFNKIYVSAVQLLLFVELVREAVVSEPAPTTYVVAVNIILLGIALFSYLLIIPRLVRSCIA
jgi:CDP-diacylglycerol--glycerol-3-phosphate 3-phosphatidyltransferase